MSLILLAHSDEAAVRQPGSGDSGPASRQVSALALESTGRGGNPPTIGPHCFLFTDSLRERFWHKMGAEAVAYVAPASSYPGAK